jgi:cyclic-di-GMP-binding protein
MPLNLSLPQIEVVIAAPKENLVAPESIPAWLAKLQLTDPVRAGRTIADQLEWLNRERLRITLRQDLNEQFFPVVQRLLAVLERSLGSGSLPLSPEARAAAKIAEDLLNHLTASYKLLLVEQSRRLFGFASSGRALLPIQRTMLLQSQRLVLAYRIYATPPKGVWTELHDLYQFAARRGLSQREIDTSSATPLSLYKAALLVAFADPLRLVHGDLDLVLSLVNRFGDRAQIGVAQERRTPQGVFVIKPQRDVSGYSVSKRHQPSPQSHDLVLNTLPVAEAILGEVAKFEPGAATDAIGAPASADLTRAKDLMGRLVKQWGAMPDRRHNRLRTHARVEICVGLADIWSFLRAEPGTNGMPAEWMVTNESANGFALMHVSGPMAPVRVGEVVGIRTRDSRSCHICVVRWVLSDTPEHLELGLEEIARNARAAQVRKVREPNAVPLNALLLPEVPEQGKASSILAPLSVLDATCELSIGDLAAKLHVRPTQTVERTASVQVIQFSSVG